MGTNFLKHYQYCFDTAMPLFADCIECPPVPRNINTPIPFMLAFEGVVSQKRIEGIVTENLSSLRECDFNFLLYLIELLSKILAIPYFHLHSAHVDR